MNYDSLAKPSQVNTAPVDLIFNRQGGLYPRLQKVVLRHREKPYLRPVAQHTRQVFCQIEKVIASQDRPIILDSGCGVGESTVILARLFPECIVIGADKSAVRLERASFYRSTGSENVLFARVELVDFWRLVHQASWPILRHFLLYPNPWPKQRDLGKRVHGHPVFPIMIELGQIIELRSNWRLYLEEFAFAYRILTGNSFAVTEHHPDPPITPFERKYFARNYPLFRLEIRKPPY